MWMTPLQALQVIQSVQSHMIERSAASLLEAVEKLRIARTPAEAFAAQAELFWANCLSGMQAGADAMQAINQVRAGQGALSDDFARPSPPLYMPATPDTLPTLRH